MEEDEKAIRIEILTEMFLGLGQSATEEQIRYYGNRTQFVPRAIFREACHMAVEQKTGGNFLPGPGDIIKAGTALDPGEWSPHTGRQLPRWARRQLGKNRQLELPQEAGPRGHYEDPEP